MNLRSRSGFTLIEAIAVLAITGLTISVLFTVGARGVFTSFRLGNRALDIADAQVARTAYRDVIASLVVPPVAVSSEAAEAELEAEVVDDSFVGYPNELAGYFIAARDTPCAPVGASGRLVLSLEATETQTTVVCRLGDEEPVVLTQLRWPGAAFAYSEDGVAWYEEWIVERGLPVENALLPNGEMRKVLVRLASADGRDQILAMAVSGRNLPQVAAVQAGGD